MLLNPSPPPSWNSFNHFSIYIHVSSVFVPYSPSHTLSPPPPPSHWYQIPQLVNRPMKACTQSLLSITLGWWRTRRRSQRHKLNSHIYWRNCYTCKGEGVLQKRYQTKAGSRYSWKLTGYIPEAFVSTVLVWGKATMVTGFRSQAGGGRSPARVARRLARTGTQE
jgi:hypothetical protein